jgi:SPP1 family predicted phage head-tail adaptor
MGTRNNDSKLRLRAGKLRHLATIESPTRSQATSGQPTISWSEFAETYVSISPLTGRELWNAQQIQPDITHQVEARYLADVTSDMRVVFNSRVFNIAEPPENVEERGILMRLLCVETG